jgi:uncharacterized membrane protein
MPLLEEPTVTVGGPAADNRGSLLTCYTIELLALAIWIGGLVVIIASVIPAVFNTIGMEAGGRLLTRVFAGYNHLLGGAIVALTASAGWRVWLATRRGVPEAALTRWELALTTLMIAIAAGITLVVEPASVRLQEEAFAALDESAKKAAYNAFFQTHQIVRGLYVVNLAFAVALMTVKVSLWVKRSQMD